MKNLKARRMHRKARALWRDGQTEQAERLAVHALDLLPPAQSASLTLVADRASVLETLAQFASDLSNHSEAQRRCDDALLLLEQVEPSFSRDEWCVAILVHKGNSQRLSARYDESALTLTHALALSERTPDSPLLPAGPLNALGILAKDRGLYEEAGSYYDRALGLLTDHAGLGAPELAAIYHNIAGLTGALAERGMSIRDGLLVGDDAVSPYDGNPKAGPSLPQTSTQSSQINAEFVYRGSTIAPTNRITLQAQPKIPRARMPSNVAWNECGA